MFDKKNFIPFLKYRYEISHNNEFLDELLDNVIDYGEECANDSRDQMAELFARLIPEVSYGEVTVFVDDDSLTTASKEEKEFYKKVHNVEFRDGGFYMDGEWICSRDW